MNPYFPLFSAVRPEKEHVKIAIEASLPSDGSTTSVDDGSYIFAVVSNVEQGVEECCILVCKRRRKDENQVRVVDGLAIGSDFQATVQQSQNTSTPGEAKLQFIMTSRGSTVSGISDDSEGIKDMLKLARDAASKLSDQYHQPKHEWLRHYFDRPTTQNSGSKTSTTGDMPIYSRFTTSSINLPTSDSKRPRPPSPTEKELRISIGTFNVNGQVPDKADLNAWLHVREDEPDILVVGLQEAESSTLSYVLWTPYVEDAWTTAVESSMGRRADEYEKLATKQLVGILLLVYVRKEVSDRLSAVALSSVGVGFGGWGSNKGATAVRFEIDEVLPICFVVSHLSAFESLEAQERRRWDYNEIVKRLQFLLIEADAESEEVGEADSQGSAADENEKGVESQPGSDAEAMLRATLQKEPTSNAENRGDVSWNDDDQVRKRQLSIMDHEVVFWTGDLNFRLDLGVDEVKRLIQKRQFESTLLKFDQLRGDLQAKSCFQDFQEQKIDFPPTYKFDRGTDQYDTSEKKRIPSWTDRVLWKDRESRVRAIHYESCPAIRISDHKPVLATFLLTIGEKR
ncbi:hypothetical protein CBS101457_005734 [Exobasidium rhododendri]|nr:hypothetical protein CBS101457_005734 [Exobasidium rhododendri]